MAGSRKVGKKGRKAPRKTQSLQFEALENRILLSADLGITAADLEQQAISDASDVIASELQLEGFDSSEFEPQVIAVDDSLTRLADAVASASASDAAPDTEQLPAEADLSADTVALTPDALYLAERMMASEIVIVDASIPQLESVIAELFASDTLDLPQAVANLKLEAPQLPEIDTADRAQESPAVDPVELIGATLEQQIALNADRDIKVFVLDSQQDGVEQVSSILDYFQEVAAVHLLSHGSAGALFLGNTKLNTQQLRNSQQQLKRWGNALADDGDLLLYGCDVAEGAVGLEFVEQLADLTGADVAASDDDTGNAEGADWDLERTVGLVETGSFVSAAMLGVLDATGTDGNDVLTNETGIVAGLKGDDTYTFTALPTSKVTVKELKNEGDDTLDLSLITANLTITIKKDNVVEVRDAAGTVKITASHIENIKGGGGNDTFMVEKGASLKGYIEGGAGTNTLTYTDANAGLLSDKSYAGAVAVDLSVSAVDAGRASAIDGFAVGGIKQIQTVIGGKSNDFLKGDSNGDELSGGKGDDTLLGHGGADTLKGDAGDDLLDGGDATDTLEGGAGNDTLIASVGGDTLIGGTGDDSYEFDDAADWNGTTVTENSDEGTDTLDFSSVSAALTFTLNDLTVTGAAVSATGKAISGVQYVERLIAGTGENTFLFRNGWADKLLIEATAGATVDLDFTAVTTDLYFTIRADGSVLVADSENRSGGHRAIIQNVDSIEGGQGVNHFSFEKGALLSGDLTGGSGTNILDYSGFGVAIDLSGAAQPPGVSGTVSGSFQVIGSARQDLLEADSSGQTLSGDAGDDFLLGGAGSDVLSGGKGDDIFAGGGGNDSFTGDKGDDSYYFSGNWGQDSAITELANGGTDTISFAGMDAVAATAEIAAVDAILAVSSSLTFTFDAGALNVADGVGAGANTLAVAASSLPHIEHLLGGSGSNSYEFKNDWWQGGSDDIDLDDTASSDGTLDFSAVTSDLKFVVSDDNGVTMVTVTTAVNGKTYTVTARGVENLIGGKGDNQYQFVGAAKLAGDLTGFSGTGAGAGTATLDFSKYDEAVAVNLAAATATALADISIKLVSGALSNINDLTGSDYGDELTGDGQANRLSGGAGNDTLRGGAGADVLTGGKGSDTLQGEGDDDEYVIDKQWAKLDIAVPPTQTDTISDDDGANTLDLTAISKDLKLTFAQDAISGTNLSVSVALGGPLSNKVNIDRAGAGSDSWTLKTGSGDDTAIINDGVDFAGTLDAGEGRNTLDYFNGSDISGGFKSSVTVDLSSGDATGFTGVSNIQDVYGSFRGGEDILTGDAQDNTFYVGAWGEIDGTAGRQHTIDGGADGSDTVSFLTFDQSDFAITADLSAGEVSHDTAAAVTQIVAALTAIENLVGGAGDDTLIGDANANILDGGTGDDTLQGGEGDDVYRFGADWGLDNIVENLAEGDDVLDFSAVGAALTFNSGRVDAGEIDLATALTHDVTVTDGVSTLTADFNVERFAGVKDTDTLQQANVTLTTAVQDEMISGLQALKDVVDALSTGYSEFSDLLDLNIPLVGTALGDLLKDDTGAAVDFATVIGAELQTRIDALKTLFWGAASATANDGSDSNTDTLLGLTDAGGSKLFNITENTRLLEFGTSLQLFDRTQSLGLDLGGTLSAIPGLDVELNPDVTTTATFDFAFGVLPADETAPADALAFHVSNPALNLSVTLFDDAINADMNLGLVAAGVADGALSMNIALAVMAEGDLSEQILLDAVNPAEPGTTIDSLFKLQAGKDTAISAELPVSVDVSGLGIDLPDLPTISLTTPALPEFPSLVDLADIFANLDWNLPDLSELLDLSAISMDQLFDMLIAGFDYLIDNFDFSLNIPGINLSLDDLFKGLPGFDLGLQDFLSKLLDPLDDFDFALGLQGLGDWLNQQIAGLLPDFPELSLPRFDFGWDGFNLDFDFDFDLNLADLLASLSLPELEFDFDFDLSTLTDFLALPDGFDLDALGITLDADGKLLADADLDIDLQLDFAVQEYAKAVALNKGTAGIDIQDYAFIGDDTRISLEATAGAENIDVEASLAISDSLPAIGFWIEDGSAIVQAAAAITLPQVSNGRYQLSGFDIGDFDLSVGGEASLDLPMYLGVGSLPMGGSTADKNGDGYADNVLHAGFDFDLGGMSAPEVVAPNFAGFNLIAFLNDPATILAGLEGMFDGIKFIMADKLGGLGLPLIGDVLKQSGAFVDELRNSLLGDKAGGYTDGKLGQSLTEAAANGDDVISLIREALYSELGDYLQVAVTVDGEPQFDELGNPLYRDVLSADDIGLVLTAEGALTFNVLLAGSVFEGLDGYMERMGDTDGDGIDDSVIKRFLEAPINFDLSAPGLGLKTGPNDTIEISLDYFFGLGFGLDGSGFFLDTAGVTQAGEELGLNLDASLSDGTSLTGTLGFLQMKLEEVDDDDGNSGLRGKIAIDLTDNDDDRWRIGETLAMSAQVSADANIDLYGSLDMDFGGQDIALPSANTTIHYDQELANITWTSEDSGFSADFFATPQVILEDVTLDVGELFSGFIGPIALELDPFLGEDSEMRRVIKILTDPIDLGVTQLTLLEIIVPLMNAKSPGTGDILRTAVTALRAVSDFISLAAEAAKDGGSIEVNFGTFDLGASLVTSESSTISNDDFQQSGGQSATDTVANSGASQNQKKLVAELGTSPGSIMFPILYDPMTAVGLLLGKDVDLFIYDTPDLQFDVFYEQSFPIFAGLNAVIKGTLSASSDFYFGFDTTGIRSWFNAFEAADYDFVAASGNLDDIFDGFFIADWAVSETGQITYGDDVAEVTLTVQLAAGVALGIGGLVEAGVLGGIEAEIGLNLHDLPAPGTGGNTSIPAVYDGKIRFDEVATIIQHNPLCLFDMEGAITAFLEAYLWVGVKVFGAKITVFEASKRFVEYVVATFEWTCPDLPDPTVATLATDGSKVLTLAYTGADGSRASAEQYEVYLDDVDYYDDSGNLLRTEERIFVTGNGHTQTFAKGDVDKIVAYGTDGKDIFEIDTAINAHLDIRGGRNDDLIIFSGNQNSSRSRIMYGNEGNDTLVGTDMADTLYGGDGNDNISAGDGVDVIYGGDGDDFIWATGSQAGASGQTTGVFAGASGFANYIDAGDGADRILTGDGNDRIIAGKGDDVITSGSGIDTIDAGDDNDQITAGAGADIVDGGSGDDVLSWAVGDGADDFTGGTGTDEIFMAGYVVNPEEFYEDDTSNYIVDDAATDTVTVADAGGNTNVTWQHGAGLAFTLTSSGVETVSIDTGKGADAIVVGNLKNTVTDNVKVSTGTAKSLAKQTRAAHDEDGKPLGTQEFKILQVTDDNALDTVRIEGTAQADDYLVSSVESVGIDGEAQTAIRYEQLDGGLDVASNPTSHVIVDVYDLEASDQTRLETLGGEDSINAQGVTQVVVSDLYLDGGADDDIIVGSSLAGTADVIIGGAGSDRLTGAVGVDRFYEQAADGTDANIEGDVDVLVETRDAWFTLSDTGLVIDDSELSGQYGSESETFIQMFEHAELTGLASANKFTLTSWSGGGILDGGAGGDSYDLELTQLANGRQYLNINDQGADGQDTLLYRGSAGSDTIQLDTVYDRDADPEKSFSKSRWLDYGDYDYERGGDGLLIAHFDASDDFTKVDLDDEDALMHVKEASLSEGEDYQVVNYASVEQVTVHGGDGNDKFISDSTSTQVDVFGDGDDDLFYIGSVLGTSTELVEGQEVTIVTEITDGANVNGSAFFGGEGDDYFEVNHNVADIGLYGDNGDDTFFIKALLTLDDDGELLDLDAGNTTVSGVSQDENNDTREVDVDTLVYVENANVSIDGGAGFDSVAVVGTVLADTFYVFAEEDEETGEIVQRIYGAGLKLQKLLNIERLQLLTGGGDDTVYLYGVDMGLVGDMVIKTGSGSDLVQVGGPEKIINLNFPKNKDLFYSTVEGFKVDQDAEGKFLPVDTVSGMPFYQIDAVGRIVPFVVDNPARTLQVTMPESYAIDAFVSPVLIDGGDGLHDQVVVNNQNGSSRIRFANTELERKEVKFDYSKFTISSGAADFVGEVLSDPAVGQVANKLLGSAAGDYFRFQDRYYDTELLNNLAADQISQLVIPEGLSYYNIQNTLQSDGTMSHARDQLLQFADDFNLELEWVKGADGLDGLPHPDPSRAAVGERLYELVSIKTAAGDPVAFEAQHKETVVFDLAGNASILKDLTALTLKTTADLTVNFAAGAVTSIETIRTDAMDTLGPIGLPAELHFAGINQVTLNLSEADAVNGSTLVVDNDRFGTATVIDSSGEVVTYATTDKLYIEGGSQADHIELQQVVAETIVHGNAGNDEITVGKAGMLDQIGDRLYLFGDAGDDTIIVDRGADSSAVDAQVDKNLLEHSTGFEQLSRITSALSLQNVSVEENRLLEAKLKEASESYADAAFAVDQSDLTTAIDEIAEDALTQLLGVLEDGKSELATSAADAADLLRLNDQQLLENQIKLYTRAKYYADNNIDDALLNKLSELGLKAKFTVSYSYDILGIFTYDVIAYERTLDVKSGFLTAEDWLRTFSSRVDIKDDDGNSQSINLDASGNSSALQQLLENADGESDVASLVYDALAKNRQTVFTAAENDGDWLDVSFKLELVSTGVHYTNDNKVKAYAKLYDTLVNDYIGSEDIFYKQAIPGVSGSSGLLHDRGLSGSEVASLYNTYKTNTAIHGFDINDPLAGGKSPNGQLVGSVDAFNLDLSADILSHRTASVQNQLNDLNLAINNSFADRYDDRFDALINQVNTALSANDYSQATLAGISSNLEALLNDTNPYDAASALDADEQLVLAPVYNLLAGNTENGLAELLTGLGSLHAKMAGADFSAVLNQAAAAAGYDDFEALFKTANYKKIGEAYAAASELIDSYLIYAAGQPDMENLPAAVLDVLREIKILDRAAERFAAFVSALESGFSFNDFRSDYLANQKAVQTFVANNPQYVAYLQSEARYEAMTASLTQDAKNVVTLAALNQQQFTLLQSALAEAQSDFATLAALLRTQYTFTFDYWWFTRTVHLDYTVDYRYVQQENLVERLQAQVADAEAYFNGSDGQLTSLNTLRTAYAGEEEDFEVLIAALGSEYEQQKDALNAQYLVLKELSSFAVEVIKARGPDQDLSGFADDASLISEIVSFYDQYNILDEHADTDPLSQSQFLTEVRDEAGNLVRGTTKSSVIFKADDRDYTAVTSVTGMTGAGAEIHVGYDDVESLQLLTGSGHDQIQVLDTLGQIDAEVIIETGAGDDEVTVTDENSTANGVTSHLLIDTGIGNNKLTINDIGDVDANSITMTNAERVGYTSVTGIARGDIHYRGSFGQGVFMQAGVGNDDITIAGVIADAHTTVLAGEGDDDVTVTSTTTRTNTDTVLTIKGEDGLDVVDASASGFGVNIEGNIGNDTIYGSSHADFIAGNEGDDLIFGGLGADTISGDAGDDLILGDLGSVTDENGDEMTRRAGLLTRAISAAVGDGDIITGGEGNDVIIGAGGADEIGNDSGNDLIFGDHAEVMFAAGMLVGAISRHSNHGEDDTIVLTGGNNVVLGGSGADIIRAAGGMDVVIGDNGQVNWIDGMLADFSSTETSVGGDDDIALAGDRALVIGGFGGDSVTSDRGDHKVLGDNGKFSFTAGVLRSLETQDASEATGGADEITLGDGSHAILGGVGGDRIGTGSGHGVVLGDNGTVSLAGDGEYVRIVSELSTLGGDDVITAAGGNNEILGGFGNDSITAGAGDDLVFGDNGQVDYLKGIPNHIKTTDVTAATGGTDTIDAGDGNNVVLGGPYGDDIRSGTGQGILIGDNGVASFGAAGERASVVSELSTLGGDDTITAVGGNNVVFGGFGNDAATSGAGDDIIFGDNGRLSYLNGILNRIETTDTSEATGGVDTLEAGDGDNIVLGGPYGDDIDSGIGQGILIGDNGFVQFNAAGDQRVQVVSELSTLGGADDINARGGNNLAFGGVGDDRIETGDGDDVLFGDNGVTDYINGLVDHYYTTDTSMDTSGHDTLISGAGNDVVIGGLGDEVIYAGEGNDKVAGDLAEVRYNTDDSDPTTLDRIFSKNSEIGGQDEIHGDDGNDVIIGGAAADRLYGGAGDDFVSGDGGLAIFTNGRLSSAETTELFIGGDDELSGGEGNDILFGGFGSDLFYGSLAEDALAGEYARALIDTSKDGFEQGVFVVRLGQGGLDLIASTQFGLYNDKLAGMGFTPVSVFTPLSASSLRTEAAQVQSDDDGQTRHRGLENRLDINNLPATGAGNGQVSDEDESEQCVNELGERVECPVEQPSEQPAEQMQQPEADATHESSGQPAQPTEALPPVEQPEIEEEAPVQSPEPANDAAAELAFVALAGWTMASGKPSNVSRIAPQGFDKLRHKQRHMQRWDEVNQCFVEDPKQQSAVGSDWPPAARKH